ncbi:MAG: ribokinase [Candidatus Marinimicrobia bacterium]|nr:ribokinase [Candidatus Neomarinimicrobiota bacterium]
MSDSKIVVIGSSNTDMIIQVERIPVPGETVLGGKFSTAAGGKGANQAVAASRGGGNVTFIASIGNDVLGDQALEGFARDGINIEYIKRVKGVSSGVALIFVAKNGENSIAVASGANTELNPDDIYDLRSLISQTKILLMQLETPIETVKQAALLAHEAGVKVILNPAPAQTLDDELLQLISIITPNEIEAELLTNVKVEDEVSAGKAAEVLLGKGIEYVLITLGARGAFFASSEIRKMIPGFKVDAIDTTAAGDVFNGALAAGLAEDKSLEEAIQFANAAAALSVTKLGAQPSAHYREEIDTFLKKHCNQYVNA